MNNNNKTSESLKEHTMATMNDLPAEIICEVAKYNPISAAKLAQTCKNFNKILEKQLKENQEIVNHN